MIPVSYNLRSLAVRKTTTVAGNPRFDAERSEAGHADEFWAHGLALHAAENTTQPAAGVTVGELQDADTYRPQAMPARERVQLFQRGGRA